MTDYDNNNRGALWGNRNKQRETQPDYKGDINIVCPHCQQSSDYWLNGWKRKPDANPKAPALSLSAVGKDEVAKDGMAQAKDALQPADDFEDDKIPF